MLEDKKLVLRLKCGDTIALRQIYDRYKSDIFSVAYALSNNSHLAEEILHESFVHFAANIGSFSFYRNLRDYLISFALDAVKETTSDDMYKVKEVEQENIIAAKIDGLDEQRGDDEKSRLMAEAVAKLPEHQREAVVLYLIGGMNFPQIANIQQVSLNTVRGRYRYGLDKLKTLVQLEVLE